jgi:hypothetical protein
MRSIYLLIFVFPFFCFSQENEFKKLLQVDSTWTNEFFQFPLSFAPTINFDGYEEAVFPIYWSDSNSVEFWSYAFAWEISRKETLSELEMETALNNYFNGLMNFDSTACKIFKEDQISDQTNYFGSISTQDAFFSQKSFILNIRIEQYFNKKTKKMLVLFKLSPQNFEKDSWKNLDEIKPLNSKMKRI